jgi:hypothetical protein
MAALTTAALALCGYSLKIGATAAQIGIQAAHLVPSEKRRLEKAEREIIVASGANSTG